MTLCELATKWGTDKGPQGHKYTPVYAGLFADPGFVAKVLEIGVGEPVPNKPSAPSLRMWEEYFPNALIYSADSNPKWFFEAGGRIQPTIFCDQGNESNLQQLKSQLGEESFDFIVDDGSHASRDQLLTLRVLLPLIRVGGSYVIEDIWENSPWVGGWTATELERQIKFFLKSNYTFTYTRTGDRDSALMIVRRIS